MNQLINIYQNYNQLNALIQNPIITEQTFNSLSKLKNLQTIEFDFNFGNSIFCYSLIKQFIESYPKIKSIAFRKEVCNLITLNSDKLLKLRKGYPFHLI